MSKYKIYCLLKF